MKGKVAGRVAGLPSPPAGRAHRGGTAPLPPHGRSADRARACARACSRPRRWAVPPPALPRPSALRLSPWGVCGGGGGGRGPAKLVLGWRELEGLRTGCGASWPDCVPAQTVWPDAWGGFFAAYPGRPCGWPPPARLSPAAATRGGSQRSRGAPLASPPLPPSRCASTTIRARGLNSASVSAVPRSPPPPLTFAAPAAAATATLACSAAATVSAAVAVAAAVVAAAAFASTAVAVAVSAGVPTVVRRRRDERRVWPIVGWVTGGVPTLGSPVGGGAAVRARARRRWGRRVGQVALWCGAPVCCT